MADVRKFKVRTWLERKSEKLVCWSPVEAAHLYCLPCSLPPSPILAFRESHCPWYPASRSSLYRPGPGCPEVLEWFPLSPCLGGLIQSRPDLWDEAGVQEDG